MALHINELDRFKRFALDRMLAGRNMFISGKAGCGKSALLDVFRRVTTGRTVYLAPTGIAARNIDGVTVNSFLGIGADLYLPGVTAPKLDFEKAMAIRATDTVLVDEIGALSAAGMTALENILRMESEPEYQGLPFGGKQIIVMGDFAQIMPTVTSTDAYWLRQYYRGVFAFESDAWLAARFGTVELPASYRHDADPEGERILDTFRLGESGGAPMSLQEAVRRCNARMTSRRFYSEDVPILCTTNDAARSLNMDLDARLGSEVYVHYASENGVFGGETYPAPPELWLRIGSRVMIVANCYDDFGNLIYANGDMGRVLDISEPVNPGEVMLVTVQLDDGREVTVAPREWHHSEYVAGSEGAPIGRRITGTFTQLPLMLGYAVTIHKSQGLTLPRAHLELGNGTFAGGQLYTAASRCERLDDVSVNRLLHPRDVKLNPKVCAFCRDVRIGQSMADPEYVTLKHQTERDHAAALGL